MTQWSTTPHGGHTVIYQDDSSAPEEERQPVWYLIPPAGPNIGVYYDRDCRQWAISINTEDMPQAETHDANAIPYLDISVNGGVIFDYEPSHSEPPNVVPLRAALERIHGILYYAGPDTEWSSGMLEDIAAIIRETKVEHPDPPPYHHH